MDLLAQLAGLIFPKFLVYLDLKVRSTWRAIEKWARSFRHIIPESLVRHFIKK
ncbi:MULTISPECIES: hypothetical protein [unclassified Microcoleus]|uniref:hypothetical protein n=1 Tax=unclassified Microcoleus TaxID=2642155 RepID=UPI0025F185A9|nr:MULTISPECIES: hypothetical protein [unclassified Microcoleus]